MIAKTLRILCLALLFWNCKSESGKTQGFDNALEQRLQKVLDSVYGENKDAIGLLVHVESSKQGISWSGKAGYSDKNKSLLKPDQPVLVASNTKTYVSAAILKLIDQSKLDLNQSIDSLIFENTNTLLKKDGYNTSKINIVHLLNHTSGIHDYATTDAYLQKVIQDPEHRYTRNEQIELAMALGDPLGNPGEAFGYADVNYLLLTEILEGLTNEPFYKAIRNLIGYDTLGLRTTWFSTLEEYPKNALPLAYQYWSSRNIDSYKVDHSFDLYGGGGIASTSRDLALFCQSLFNNAIYESPNTLDLIYTKVKLKSGEENDYHLGLSSKEINGLKAFGHGGFWGTTVNYFPDLDTSIAIFVLERDKRILRLEINSLILEVLKTE